MYFYKPRKGNALYTRWETSEDVAYPINNPPLLKHQDHIQKSKKLWTKGIEWNNTAYEEKEKSHYFPHPAQDTANSHPHFNQEKEWGRKKKWDPHQEQERVNKGKKIGGKKTN